MQRSDWLQPPAAVREGRGKNVERFIGRSQRRTDGACFFVAAALPLQVQGAGEKKHLPRGHVGAARLTTVRASQPVAWFSSSTCTWTEAQCSKQALPVGVSARPPLSSSLPDVFQKDTRIVLSPPVLTITGDQDL